MTNIPDMLWIPSRSISSSPKILAQTLEQMAAQFRGLSNSFWAADAVDGVWTKVAFGRFAYKNSWHCRRALQGISAHMNIVEN